MIMPKIQLIWKWQIRINQIKIRINNKINFLFSPKNPISRNSFQIIINRPIFNKKIINYLTKRKLKISLNKLIVLTIRTLTNRKIKIFLIIINSNLIKVLIKNNNSHSILIEGIINNNITTNKFKMIQICNNKI